MKTEAQKIVQAMSPAQKLRAAERLYHSARQLKAAALRALRPSGQPFNRTTHGRPAHPLRNPPQTGTLTRFTSTTTAASSSTASPFRINIYTSLPQLLILNYLHKS